jgi:hypothetical protein
MPDLQIAIINESTLDGLDTQIERMVPAISSQWNNDLAPVWGIRKAKFEIVPHGGQPRAGAWWVVFLDDSDQAQALAYHDLTSEGLPISKVFAKTIAQANVSLSVGATHEICEMAVDPWLNNAYQDRHGTFWAGEVCDPVEDDRYGYEIGGVLVTDFVTPNWFAHKHALNQVDFKEHANDQFEVLAGGYAQRFIAGSGWQQVTGASAELDLLAMNPPRGSRRERRARIGKDEWYRSARRAPGR